MGSLRIGVTRRELFAADMLDCSVR